MDDLIDAPPDPHTPPDGRAQVASLYQEHALTLVRLAKIMLGDQAAAEDVVQDAFLGLSRRWPSLDDHRRAVGYLRASVLNGCRNAHRGRARRDRALAFAGQPADIVSAEESALIGKANREVMADSRVVMQVQNTVTTDKTKTRYSGPCANEVTAGDGTVVCGTQSVTDVAFEEVCSMVPPSFVTYSGTTGKQLNVLYQWHGQCLYASAYPLWTDSAGRHVIAYLFLSEKGIKTSLTSKVGLIANGRFTALPQLANARGADFAPGGIAF